MNQIEKIRCLPYMSMRLNALADFVETIPGKEFWWGCTWSTQKGCGCIAGNLYHKSGLDPSRAMFKDSEIIRDAIGECEIVDSSGFKFPVEDIRVGFGVWLYLSLGIEKTAPESGDAARDAAVEIIRAIARRIEVLLKDIEEDAAITKIEAPEAEWEMVEVGS